MTSLKIFIKELQDSHSMLKIQIQKPEIENPEIQEPKISSASKKKYNNLHRKHYSYFIIYKFMYKDETVKPVFIDSFYYFKFFWIVPETSRFLWHLLNQWVHIKRIMAMEYFIGPW